MKIYLLLAVAAAALLILLGCSSGPATKAAGADYAGEMPSAPSKPRNMPLTRFKGKPKATPMSNSVSEGGAKKK